MPRTSIAMAVIVVLVSGLVSTPVAGCPAWRYSGTVHVLTTPDGADLPASAVLEGFPLLVRLHADFFDFTQARPDGGDLRVATERGEPLACEIEEWSPQTGVASVWVRVPRITGNTRLPLKLFWGNADAMADSTGGHVFDASNGYSSVWHMHDPVSDAVGTLESRNDGTTATAGVIGLARHLAGKQGVFCGDAITTYPSGAAPHSTEAWIRTNQPNTTIVGWGNEGGGRGTKVSMQLRSPPHLRIDSFFANVSGTSRLPMGEWVHVAHTYERENSRVYVNGRLDGATKPLLAIKTPCRLWIGGWYQNYDFVGDIDEVRISQVTRSADWIRLEYENQKPLQTLVGPVVAPGDDFSVSPSRLEIAEGEQATITAHAGGALKLFWLLDRGGVETVVATDRLRHTFAAGRVSGDTPCTLRLRAVYPDGVRTRDVAITVRETMPDPTFTLQAPSTWDGRASIEVIPRVGNLAALRAAGAGDLRIAWDVTDIATIRSPLPDRLRLTRAFKSGTLTVTATIDNGGTPSRQTATLTVHEPAFDPWHARKPAPDEQPEDNQFFARDDTNEGTLHYNGRLTTPADAVFLRLFADGRLVGTTEQRPAADGTYALSARLKAGLIRYAVDFGTRTDGRETVVRTVKNLVCGDAFLICGQSNAVATDFGKDDPAFRSEWIRSFGSMSGNPQPATGWGNAVHRSREDGRFQIGYWGMDLARRLVESHRMPICILNGAVGGTRIDQHQRSHADPADTSTIYGRLLWRVRRAGLTHGIRGVLWHQGENDQGADGPTGGFGWETYRSLFIDLAAAWQEDYPNLRHMHMFQIWPKACAMGIDGSDNRLREVQRQLPAAFSNLAIMSTLGIDPPGGCHFPAAGYAEFARLIEPLVARDHYGTRPTSSITPPNLLRAVAGETDAEIVVEFDQPVTWDASLAGQFMLDGAKGLVRSGAAAGNRLTMTLTATGMPRTISYIDGASWDRSTLLRGTSGIAALSFCDVPILPRTPAQRESR